MNYITYQQKDCFTGCVVNALNALGIKCSEAEVLLYGGGFKIRYKTMSTPEDTKYLLYGELREASINFLNMLGVKYVLTEYDNLEKALLVYYEAKSEGASVMFVVAADSIRYHQVFRQAAGSQHCLNILDIDEVKGTARVSDGYIPTTPVLMYEGDVPLGSLYEGYQKSGYNTLIIYPSEEKIEDFRCPKKEKQMIQEMLEHYIKGEQEGENYIGKSAILKICDDLNMIKDWERERFRVKMMDFNTLYKTWGFVGSKRILAEFFAERDFLSEYYGEMNDIAEKWNGLARYIVKTAIAYRPAMIDSFREKVKELVSKEEELFAKIIDI